MEDDGVNDAAERGARRRNANRCTDPRGEIRRQDRHAGHEQRARTDADAEGLREENLPVLVTQGQHHLAEDEHDAAKDEELAEVACVVDGARQSADHEEEKRLDGADPGDG